MDKEFTASNLAKMKVKERGNSHVTLNTEGFLWDVEALLELKTFLDKIVDVIESSTKDQKIPETITINGHEYTRT